MTVLSKCFNHVLSTQNCHQIVHPHTSSCMHSALASFWKPVPTTAKFFLPFFLVTTSKWVRINKTWFNLCFLKRFPWHPSAISLMDWRAENWSQLSCTQPQRHFWPEPLDDGSCASCSRWFFLFRISIHIRIPISLWFQQFVESIHILLDCMHSSVTWFVDYLRHAKQSGDYVCAQCICYGLWWNNRNLSDEMSFHCSWLNLQVLQVMIMKGDFAFFRCISTSKLFRTVTFMSLSALLLDSLKFVKADISW